MDKGTENFRPDNPIKKASWLSQVMLWYSIPTFVLGYQGKFNIDSIYGALPEHKSSYLGDTIEKKWQSELKKAGFANRNPSLTRVLVQMFGFSYLGHGVITAISELFVKILQPLALGKFIAFFTPNQTEISLTEAYIYGGIIIICSLFRAVLKNPNCLGISVLVIKAKLACSSLVYRKTLKIKKGLLQETGGGQILNMLTSDLNKFDSFALFANYIWIIPIQIVIVIYFMYKQVGFSSVIGVLIMALIIPIFLILGKKLSVHRSNVILKSDERINLMEEIIRGIEFIKMHTWERQFSKSVDKARRNEIMSISKASNIKGVIAALHLCLTHIALYGTVLVYALLYHDFNAEQVFVLISYYNILKTSLTLSFGYGISSAVELMVSIRRINKFMNMEESQELHCGDSKDVSVTLFRGTVKWSKSSQKTTLSNINFRINQSDLVAIVGPVGSGKSSLLYTILGELPLLKGNLNVNGTISYASQEAWIFPTSVRQNILFGRPMNKSRYKKVIKYCSLKRDLDFFPHGDKTVIGENGINLSGGQKSRVNLARAVYRNADIYLLDDPLSAVDGKVGKRLFEDCICKFLKHKTVILVTHQLQYLKTVDNIFVLNNGHIKMEGDFHTLQHSSPEFANLLAETKTQKPKMDKNLLIQSISSLDRVSIKEPKEIGEKPVHGSIPNSLYKVYCTAGSSRCLIYSNGFLFLAVAILPCFNTYFLTVWVNSMQEYHEEISIQNNTSGLIMISIERFPHLTTNLYIYSGIVGAIIIISVLRSYLFYRMCMQSSIKLHDELFKSITRATMRFFYDNNSGRILNRFSKDLRSLDEILPESILFFLDYVLIVVVSISLIVNVNPWLIIPSAILYVIFQFIKRIYLKTSNAVKRLERITKSPVLTHLSLSVQGLSVIRAFKVQSILEKEFDNHQDLYSSTLYICNVTERALGFFVDILGTAFIGIVTMSFPLLGTEKYGGNVGLSVTLVISLTNALQFWIRRSTQMENEMTAVERIVEYSNIENEGPLKSKPHDKPSNAWPEKGRIEFSNVDLRYFHEKFPVLKDLNFIIQPKEKVGVVGRTGAGKSSIIRALLRLAETKGSIKIDDISIDSIGLHDLRFKISVIPQQPMLMTGTLRRNLDPFENYNDDVLWKALEQVCLKSTIAALPLGLETPVLDGGENFSKGQRQLICLAHAIIQDNKILVMDEATASIDLNTDILIQETIKRNFNSCTVITIAHRLNTVIDYDKIMVLDLGKLVEFDHPYLLLQKTNGFFYRMVEETGELTAKMLTSIAEKCKYSCESKEGMDNSPTNKRPENPIKRANWISRFLLWYSIPTFVLGFKNKINIDTIYETLPEHKSSYLGNIMQLKWKDELKRAHILKRKPSLKRVLMKLFGLQYLCCGLAMAVCELCIKIAQPVALGHFIAYFNPNQTDISVPKTYIYCSIIIMCSLLKAFFKNTTFVEAYVLGMKAKIACSSLIYRKVLRLGKNFFEETGSGKTINLITNDVAKFDNLTSVANYLWVSPFQVIIITYFMYRQVGFSSLVGLLTLILVVPILLILGKKLYVYKLNSTIKADLRINIMNEIIKGIEAIKMYTWEKQFVNIVDQVRRDEIKFVRKSSYTKGLILVLRLCLNHLALYATILIYALLYHTFDAEQIFVLISYYNILKQTLTMSFGYGIAAVAELLISIKRIQEFLLIEENQEILSMDFHNNTTSFIGNQDYSVILTHGTVNCLNSSKNDILHDINLKVNQGGLVTIVGPVGSGKSSLLLVILKELSLTIGDLFVNGTVSYASQESWIFPTSVRQNILFGLPMNKTRYKKVIKCCGLKRDIDLFPYGDKTLLGERGINLSGGQKSRVNLARAVYRDADIYLLDDPLSAVDTRMGKQLFEKCICKLLNSKTVILVTHQLQYLRDVDNIVMLENGIIKKQGDFFTLEKSSVEFENLLQKSMQNNSKVDDKNTFATQSYSSIDDISIEEPIKVEEQYKSGSVSKSLYKTYFTAGSGSAFLFLHAILFVLASVSPNICTYFLTYWVNSIQHPEKNFTGNGTAIIKNSIEYMEDFDRNIYIYSGLVAATVLLCVLRSLWFYNICMTSSIKLHDCLFRGVIRATMRFFNINSSGRILNRFSRDMGILDDSLADNILAFLDIVLVMVSSIILIVTVNGWLAIPSVAYCGMFYWVRKINLTTNIGIKRLEGITKSSVISYTNVSIQGLSTIRAFGVQSILEKEYDNHQDLYSSTLYIFIVSERALSLFVDLIGVVYISVIVLSFPILSYDFLSGNVGMAISLAMGLTTALQFCIRQLTLVETQMTAVERVLEYANTEPEAALESKSHKKPSKSWPQKGKIDFVNVYLRYSVDECAILKNLNFSIQPLEKIGIVGRTGSGKSSIIKALFRLAETTGSIAIDGLLIHNLGLHDLRGKISIIPQNPTFISGSLRRNLDPFNSCSDQVLWTALEEVELKEFVANLPAGLETQVLDCGSNFSVGQRQLICLARAIVSNNKILVMDEATANIDLTTDVLIQNTIKQKFNNCTVLTIAHRLNTVMNSDKIMVLDEGILVEFDHPYVLLQKPNGIFYNMVEQTGEESAQELTILAEKCYRGLHQPMPDLIVL